MKTIHKILLTAYLFGAIFTFGHAEIHINQGDKLYDNGPREAGALLAAAFWPLYISTQYWKHQ